MKGRNKDKDKEDETAEEKAKRDQKDLEAKEKEIRKKAISAANKADVYMPISATITQSSMVTATAALQ